MQIDKVVKGDAKSFKIQINTTYGPLDLGSYSLCGMYLYEEDDFSTPIMKWESSDPTRAVFFDRSKGIIQFYIVSSDTDTLDAKQYSYRMKVQKDIEHTYTVHEGILEIVA